MSSFRSFYDNYFDTTWSKTKQTNKQKIHYAHIALYLGSAIALPMIVKTKLETYRYVKKPMKYEKLLDQSIEDNYFTGMVYQYQIDKKRQKKTF